MKKRHTVPSPPSHHKHTIRTSTEGGEKPGSQTFICAAHAPASAAAHHTAPAAAEHLYTERRREASPGSPRQIMTVKLPASSCASHTLWKAGLTLPRVFSASSSGFASKTS